MPCNTYGDYPHNSNVGKMRWKCAFVQLLASGYNTCDYGYTLYGFRYKEVQVCITRL